MRGPRTLTVLIGAGAVLAGTAPGATAAAAGETCHYELERQVDRRVQMSQVHGWTGVSSTFRYASENSADTYVGVAVQGRGGWVASGTDHVTNAKVFGQTATLRGRGNRRVTGVFKFNILKRVGRDCPPNTVRRFTRAYRFEGGMRVEKGKRSAAPAGLAGRCNTAPGRRKLYPSTSVFTATAKSFTYDRSFTLVGITLGSSTTFSKNAQIELRNHGKRAVWVCGMSVDGRAVPIAEAAMIYAGPRVRRG